MAQSAPATMKRVQYTWGVDFPPARLLLAPGRSHTRSRAEVGRQSATSKGLKRRCSWLQVSGLSAKQEGKRGPLLTVSECVAVGRFGIGYSQRAWRMKSVDPVFRPPAPHVARIARAIHTKRSAGSRCECSSRSASVVPTATGDAQHRRPCIEHIARPTRNDDYAAARQP